MCMRCIEQNRLNWSQEPLKGQFRVKQFNHISANKTLHKLRENPEFIYPLSLALMKLWDWEVKDLLSGLGERREFGQIYQTSGGKGLQAFALWGTNNLRYWHAKLKEMKPKGGAKGWEKHQQHHSGNPMQ